MSSTSSLHKATRVVLEGKVATAAHVDAKAALANASDLKGKVVLVTGAASGIGKQFATEVAKLGANLIIGDLNETALAAVAKELTAAGAKVSYKKTDVTNWDELSALFKTGHAEFGRIEHVVANAGILEAQSLLNHDGPEDEPTKPNLATIDVDLVSVIYTTKLAFYYLKKNSTDSAKSLTLLGSMASHVGLPTTNLYSTAKHAVLGLFKSTYWDGKANNINVNIVCPWFVKTPLLTPELLGAITGLGTATVDDVSAAISLSASGKPGSGGKIICVDADGIIVVDHPSWANGEDGEYGIAVGRAASALGA